MGISEGVSAALDIALIICYLSLFVAGVSMHLEFLRNSLPIRSSLFVAFLEMAVLARVGESVCFLLWSLDVISEPQGWVLFILSSFPTFCFLAMYMFLLLLWGELYLMTFQFASLYTNKIKNLAQKLRISTYVLTGFLLVSCAVIYTTSFLVGSAKRSVKSQASHQSTPVEFSALGAELLVFFIATGTFFTFAYIVFAIKTEAKASSVDPKLRKTLTTVGVAALICIICQLLLQFLVILSLTVSAYVSLLKNQTFATCELFFLEILPVSLEIYALGQVCRLFYPKKFSRYFLGCFSVLGWALEKVARCLCFPCVRLYCAEEDDDLPPQSTLNSTSSDSTPLLGSERQFQF